MEFQVGKEYRTSDGRIAKIERVSPSGYAAGRVGKWPSMWRPDGVNHLPGVGRGSSGLDIVASKDDFPLDFDGGDPARTDGGARRWQEWG